MWQRENVPWQTLSWCESVAQVLVVKQPALRAGGVREQAPDYLVPLLGDAAEEAEAHRNCDESRTCPCMHAACIAHRRSRCLAKMRDYCDQGMIRQQMRQASQANPAA